MKDTIHVDTIKMQEKIAELKTLSESLNANSPITTFAFGLSSTTSSTGNSANAMMLVNKEYSADVQKFSQLVNKTIIYLENVVAAFKEADASAI